MPWLRAVACLLFQIPQASLRIMVFEAQTFARDSRAAKGVLEVGRGPSSHGESRFNP